VKTLAILILMTTPANAYWGTAGICLRVAHVETYVVIKAQQAGSFVKHAVRKILHKQPK
jgi:hypothetical protein